MVKVPRVLMTQESVPACQTSVRAADQQFPLIRPSACPRWLRATEYMSRALLDALAARRLNWRRPRCVQRFLRFAYWLQRVQAEAEAFRVLAVGRRQRFVIEYYRQRYVGEF